MMAAGRLLNFLNVFLCHHNVQCIIIIRNAVPFIKQKLEYKSPRCNPDNWKDNFTSMEDENIMENTTSSFPFPD